VWLGDSAWYSTLLFEITTRWVPFYRVLWELAPYIATAISFAAITWSVWRVAGRWAAAITLSLLVCAGAPLLTQFGMLDNHVLTWFSDSLLIAGLVWVLDPVRPVPRSRWLPAAIALGLLVALNLASDPLLYFGGIGPTLAGATIACRRSANTRALEGVRYALLTCTIAVVGSIIVVHLMTQHQIVPSPGWTVGLAPGWEISQNATLWWQSLALLGGNAYSGGSTVLSLVHTAAAVLTVTAVAIIPCVVFVELRRGSTGKAANAERPPSVGSERPLGREAFVVAWGASGMLVSAAFVLSTAPVDLGTTRYLVSAYRVRSILRQAARSMISR
jgi:hypothetical protein